MDLLVIFLTGLTVGGLTCLAVQGGLLASVIAARGKENFDSQKKNRTIFPTVAFLISKLVSYTMLGFILGSLGSAISLTESIQTVMQILAGIYMIIIALNLLDVHPIFRYFVIQPPRFLTRYVRSRSKSADLFAPAVLGFLTIFIPCGTTLAMEALAISSASGIKGAAIMATFVLGTFPMFFGLGVVTAKLGDSFRLHFLRVAAVILVFLGLASLYGGAVAAGAPITLSKLSSFVSSSPSTNMSVFYPPIKNGYQHVSINVSSGGYDPSQITLKQGVPTRLTLKTNGTYSCAIAFRIPALRIGINLKPTGEELINLPPLNKGEYLYTCSMGMYQGILNVI